MEKYYNIVLLFIILLFIPFQTLGDSIPFGLAYAEGGLAPDGLDVRYKYWDSSTSSYLDFTDKSLNHYTESGLYKAAAKADNLSTPEKDGFSDGDTVYIFIDYELAKRDDLTTPLTFEFQDNDNSQKDAAYITYIAPEPVGSFSGSPMASGKIYLSWSLSPSEDVMGYNIYYDNATGTIDYSSPYAQISHPGDHYETEPLSSGATYTFGIRVMDTSGKEEESDSLFVSVTADASAVSLSISAPAENETISGTNYAIIGTVSASDINYFKLFYGESHSPEEWYAITTEQSGERFNETLANFDTTALNDGLYTIKLYAKDNVGNESSEYVHITIQNNAESKISSPANNEYVSGEVSIIGTAEYTNFKKYTLEYKRPDSESESSYMLITESYDPVNNSVLGTLNTDGISGTVYIRFRIYNTSDVVVYEQTIKVFAENHLPVLRIDSPEPISYTNSSKISVYGSASTNYTLKINNTSTSINKETGAFARTVTLSSNQTNYITLEVTSPVNLTNQYILKVIHDSMAPTITNITPESGSVTETVLPIKIYTEHNISVSVNGAMATETEDGVYTYYLLLNSENQTNVSIVAKDKAGNSTEESRTYQYNPQITDSFPPLIKDIYGVNNGSFKENTPEIKFCVSEDYAGLDTSKTVLKIDDVTVTPTQTSLFDTKLYTISYTPSYGLSRGDHTFYLKVVDNFSNSSELSGNFTIDTGPQILEIPIIYSYTSSTAEIKVKKPDDIENTEELNAKIWVIEDTEKFAESSNYSNQKLILVDNIAGYDPYYYGTLNIGTNFIGKIIVKTNAEDKAGNNITDYGYFLRTVVHGNSGAELTLPDGLKINIKNNQSFDETISIFTTDTTEQSSYYYKKQEIETRGLIPLSSGYTINIDGYETFSMEATIYFPYKDEDADGVLDDWQIDVKHVKIFKFNSDTNKFEVPDQTVYKPTRHIVVNVNSFSDFLMMADTEPPVLIEKHVPASEEVVDSPVFTVKAEDKGTGIDYDSVNGSVNGMPLAVKTYPSKNLMVFYPEQPLRAADYYKYELIIPDKASNYLKITGNFNVTTKTGFSEIIAYPSPARDSITFRYRLYNRVDEVIIKIYDDADRLIQKLYGDPTGDWAEIEWDLVDRRNRELANGAYVYKVLAIKNGKVEACEYRKFMVIR